MRSDHKAITITMSCIAYDLQIFPDSFEVTIMEWKDRSCQLKIDSTHHHVLFEHEIGLQISRATNKDFFLGLKILRLVLMVFPID